MPVSQFIGPIVTTGYETPHFYNGRLLTADDLKAGQEATALRQAWIGQSSGYGIIDGLQVKAIESGTKLRISQGIAMNRNGKIIHFREEISLPPLPPKPDTNKQAAPRPGLFASVKEPEPPIDERAAGVYLLTIVPTSEGYKGTAATQMQTGNGVVSSSRNLPGTASQSEVERIRFKVIRFADSNLTGRYNQDDLGDITVTDENRRNLVAHWFYGTLKLQQLGNDPLAQQHSDIDPFSEVEELTGDDIPLATFHWDGKQLTFADMWSVRRRLVRHDALTGNWSTLLSDKRIAANQARFLQFQDHLDELVQQHQRPGQPALNKLDLTKHFAFLPPVGFLPTATDSLLQRIPEPGSASNAAKQVAQGGGALPDVWNSITGGIGNITKALDPRNWMSFLHIGMNIQAQRTQNLEQQIADLRKLISDLEKQAGKGAASDPTGAEATDTTEAETQPLLQALEQALSIPDQAFHGQIRALLDQRTDPSTKNGFDLAKSFAATPLQVKLIGSDSVNALVQQSWYQDAIDLRNSQAGQGGTERLSFPTAMNVYLVTENVNQTGSPVYTIFHKAAQPTLLLDHPLLGVSL